MVMAPAQRRRQRHRLLVAAPEHVDQLLGDDQAAGGDQDLLQVLAVDRHDDDALEGPAEHARARPWPPAWRGRAPRG